MDWKTLYLTASGRIGQRDFWIGWLILFVAGLILGAVFAGAPMVGAIVGLAMLYPYYCLLAKRFQDIGKTGRLALVPVAISVVIQVLALVTALGLAGAALSGNSAALGGAVAGAMGLGSLALIGVLVSIGFVLWAGLTRGDPGDNQYGPPPRQLIGGSTPTVA